MVMVWVRNTVTFSDVVFAGNTGDIMFTQDHTKNALLFLDRIP